jgi:hypothetical protein
MRGIESAISSIGGSIMSILDKVKEMFGGHRDKLKDIPQQGREQAEQRGYTERAEEAAGGGVDRGADWARDKTGGRFDEQIDSGADQARQHTDRIDDENA